MCDDVIEPGGPLTVTEGVTGVAFLAEDTTFLLMGAGLALGAAGLLLRPGICA